MYRDKENKTLQWPSQARRKKKFLLDEKQSDIMVMISFIGYTPRE